uniref:MFS transporter n=1 Tax=Prevotella sp. GTC17260 TaxID=3236796 RepID=A0AB33JCB3_9BACT
MNIRMMKYKNPWLWVSELSFAESLSFVALMTLSMILYKQLGLSNSEVTFYTSWLYLPWVLKPLLRPFLPVIRDKRAYVSMMQLLIGAAFGGVAFFIPSKDWLQGTLFFFWLMAFATAIHSVFGAAYYEQEPAQRRRFRVKGIYTVFHHLAIIFGQGVLVMIAGNLQVIYRNSISYSWSLVFYGVAGLFIAFWLWIHYALPGSREQTKKHQTNIREQWSDFRQVSYEFLQRPQTWLGLLFALFYIMPQGLLVRMSPLFLLDSLRNGGLGLSPQEFGFVQGTVGIIGLALGGLLGGMAIRQSGLKAWLWPMVLAFTLPDVVYVYLSHAVPTSLMVINLCVFLEQLGYGFGLTAYMSCLSYYCQGEHKNLYHSLYMSMMALGMLISGLFSGMIQAEVGYKIFFVIAVVSNMATFIVVALVRVTGDYGRKSQQV